MIVQEFFNSGKRLAIWPENDINRDILLKEFDRLHYRNSRTERYFYNNNWIRFGKKTCYDNRGGYDSKENYEEVKYEIIYFKDIEFDKDLIISRAMLKNLIESDDINHIKNELNKIERGY